MYSLLKKIFRYTYKVFFSKYDVVIEKECAGFRNLLDVGCGSYSPVHTFSRKLHCVGVDAFGPSIEESKRRAIHQEYHQLEVLEIENTFKPKSFDAVVALDLIEHLGKSDGLKLIGQMEKLAARKVFIFTPNGFIEQGDRNNNPWQVHLSGWTVDEFRNMGYRVIGINGWKFLRGKYAKVKYWPALLWVFISDVTELFVKKNPKNAYQLLAIKEMK
jgi:hypothetical protein